VSENEVSKVLAAIATLTEKFENLEKQLVRVESAHNKEHEKSDDNRGDIIVLKENVSHITERMNANFEQHEVFYARITALELADKVENGARGIMKWLVPLIISLSAILWSIINNGAK
jgi:SMC interacting uncharacterized protein involved in chromosome segregation